MPVLQTVLLALSLLSGAPASAELSLVMVEQEGCLYCARWDEEIAPIWPKSRIGEAVPLRRIDLHAPVPADLTLDGAPRYTPTFVLVEDGAEVGRIEGYPGADFFWPMVSRLIETAGDAPDP